ncbi:MAG: HEPN domain-containing protein [Aigarchaeota archaeon]|nr:HEPN domain-containing protein [Candidatus Pelearchaeum maunauluense]
MDRAIIRMDSRDWAGVVEAAQLAAENAAKAVIAHFHIPSWTHDPSGEIMEILSEISVEYRDEAGRLAEIARTLAPEHARTRYGEPLIRKTPGELYNEEKAANILGMAKEAVDMARRLLNLLGYKPV